MTRAVIDGATPFETVVGFTGTEDLTGTIGSEPFVFLPGLDRPWIDGGAAGTP